KNDEEIHQVEGKEGRISTRSGNGNARIADVDITRAGGQSVRSFLVGEQVKLCCHAEFYKNMDNPTVGILLRDRMGNDVYGTNTSHLGESDLSVVKGDCLEVTFTLALNIGPGNYSVCVAIHAGDSHLVENCDWWDQCLVFQVIAGDESSFVGVAALPAEVVVTKNRLH
ncbi:MAG: Wzt carbohydrate-binding domain-containing protein, partial [Proteobacteria bacterium]|nr:Wzt carbohydrate-binding domain-containing protein [Pseudomonadota bacterium]